MINEAALAHLEDSILVTVNDSCIAYSKSNISLLNVFGIELGKTLRYLMLSDPISNISEKTHPKIAMTDRIITVIIIIIKQDKTEQKYRCYKMSFMTVLACNHYLNQEIFLCNWVFTLIQVSYLLCSQQWKWRKIAQLAVLLSIHLIYLEVVIKLPLCLLCYKLKLTPLFVFIGINPHLLEWVLLLFKFRSKPNIFKVCEGNKSLSAGR